MKINILSARRNILAGEAKEVVLPGEEGEFAIWDFHQPCIARLKPGRIKVRLHDIKNGAELQEDVIIMSGIVRVRLNSISIFVEEAEKKRT